MKTATATRPAPTQAAPKAGKKRLRELDFLRGLAIILVLFRHTDVAPFLTNMGWIGVDLFFVLSGYLVSGLLFREYQRSGSISPKRFLVRRGFKIYPIYYTTYLLYLVPLIWNGDLALGGLASDLLFFQNYHSGWGYAYAASWSLAVEEHFYIGLALALYAGTKSGWLSSSLKSHTSPRLSRLEHCIYVLFAGCLLARFASNLALDTHSPLNFTMTHLRLDSLLAGVLIAYLHHFKTTAFTRDFHRYKRFLIPAALLALAWTPFFDPTPSFFAKTSGFTLVAFAFSVLLCFFLLQPNINTRLDAVLARPVVNAVSSIGVCSYSIYVMHTLVNNTLHTLEQQLAMPHYPLLFFILSSGISIGLGVVLTHRVEHYFLAVRNKYFPSR